MEKQLYAKIIEDNGGGISLYVMDVDDKCIYAHGGYEYTLGTLIRDLRALIEDDSIADWEGNEEEMVAEWEDLEIDPRHRKIIASVADGKLTTYPDRMGAAGRAEFGSRD